MILNNPSNPCGSVFSKDHLKAVIELSKKYGFIIISDEVYHYMVYPQSKDRFIPIASLATDAPIITCSGIAKRFLVPGWRLGWVAIHDPNGILSKAQIPQALFRLTTLTLGASHPIQGAIPTVLTSVPPRFFNIINSLLESNFSLVSKSFDNTYFTVVPSQGALYTMVKIHLNALSFSSDVEFVKCLFQCESVFVLPGTVFQAPSFFRIVLCADSTSLKEAITRINRFASDHHI